MDKILLKKLQSRFIGLWLGIFVLVLLIVGGRLFFISSHSPSLQDVLSHNSPANSVDLSLLIASLLAVSLVTLSAAKGYEVFKKSRSVGDIVLPEAESELPEVKIRLDYLLQENAGYKNKISRQRAEIEELKETEQMLRKSNISLAKEYEKLKGEQQAVKPKRKARKTKVKQKVKKKQ